MRRSLRGCPSWADSPGRGQFHRHLGSAEEIIAAPTPVIGAVVTGNAQDNVLAGTAGSDLINGNGGADTITGAGGNDELVGGAGADTINGGPGDDLIRGGVGNDTVNGQGGADTVLIQAGDTGIDSIDGGVGQDTFTNTLAGPITLQAISQFEIVNGGNRAIVGGDGQQVFDLSAAVTMTGVTQIEGGPGADIITGSTGTNIDPRWCRQRQHQRARRCRHDHRWRWQ